VAPITAKENRGFPKVTEPPGGRREALLDVAAEMVSTGDIDGVSMESVAARAGVSRALVYKHFANRHELLAALYERESTILHAELSAAVQRSGDLEAMLRALIEGALAAQASRGATFATLGSQGGRTAVQRERQRRRDARTLRYFTGQAMRELGLHEAAATAGMTLALGTIATVLDRWRRERTPEHAQRLADTYVAMVIGGLRALRTGEANGPDRAV
jgi:AcrR family transcriptional regulator